MWGQIRYVVAKEVLANPTDRDLLLFVQLSCFAGDSPRSSSDCLVSSSMAVHLIYTQANCSCLPTAVVFNIHSLAHIKILLHEMCNCF